MNEWNEIDGAFFKIVKIVQMKTKDKWNKDEIFMKKYLRTPSQGSSQTRYTVITC